LQTQTQPRPHFSAFVSANWLSAGIGIVSMSCVMDYHFHFLRQLPNYLRMSKILDSFCILVYLHTFKINIFNSLPTKIDKIQKVPENCFILNPEFRQLDIEKTVLALEPFISKLEFFDLCSKLALDQVSRLFI
jgi:hypothetical protein